ncbi:hypothetical protein TNCV_4318051 [Trichonephila clavipes]|nr:hypothetical protein TNCV_4318051 [Trichonephila clavipes]
MLVTTDDEPWHRVEAALASVPAHAIQSLFDSMPRRISAVFTARGGCSGAIYLPYPVQPFVWLSAFLPGVAALMASSASIRCQRPRSGTCRSGGISNENNKYGCE